MFAGVAKPPAHTGGVKPGQRRRAIVCAEGLGPCPVGVQGFESPPPHHFEAPRTLSPIIAAKIAEHAYWMKREGYRDSTIRAAVKALRSIGRRCNLLDPNAFKDYVAKAEYRENRRDHILDDAKRFYS